MVRKLLGLILLVFATPALAVTYTGSEAPPSAGYFNSFTFPLITKPGLYYLDYALSRPEEFDLLFVINTVFDYHLNDGTLLYVDDLTSDLGGMNQTPARSGSFLWTIPPEYQIVYDGSGYTQYYTTVVDNAVAFGNYDDGAPYSWRFSITAVPEPANWLLLIGGFGLAGASQRRRASSTFNSYCPLERSARRG